MPPMCDEARTNRNRGWKTAVAATLSGLLSSGCVTPLAEPPLDEPYPTLERGTSPVDGASTFEHGASPADGSLSLPDARRTALEESPILEGSAWSVRAEEARRDQADRWPNPELVVDVENVGGGGDYRGFDNAETTIALAQPLELGGKRRRRVDVAESSATLLTREHVLREREVAATVTSAFVAALTHQRQLELAESRYAVIVELVKRIAPEVERGRVARNDLTQAQAELTRVNLARSRARSSLGVARVRLAALRGIEADLPATLEGELERVGVPPPLEELLGAVLDAPIVERWDQEVVLQQATLHLERSRRVPDVAVIAGYRRFSGIEVNTAVFGLALPLPLFDRNQGSIAAARLEVERARSGRREARLRLRAELALAYEGLLLAFDEAHTLREQVVPVAVQLFDETRDAYIRGEAPMRALLEAERSLFDGQAQLLAALERYHLAVVEVERLVDVDVGPEP
jgi:cobalt-zinc-cadmium efflux system outer membrane protein